MNWLSVGISVVVSIFMLILTIKLNRNEKHAEKRSDAQQQESIIIMKSLKAIGHLSEANAIALRDGKVNGATKTALDYYKETKDGLDDYLLLQNARANHS